MDQIITELMDLSWADLAKLLAIAVVIGIGPTLKGALNKRVEDWGDRDRHTDNEEKDVERVVEKVRKNSALASTMPLGMVRSAVRKHRSSDAPPTVH